MQCPNCHTDNRPAANFCKRCGYTLATHCPRCGRDLPPEPDFCDHCGLALTVRAQAQWSVASPPVPPMGATAPVASTSAPPPATIPAVAPLPASPPPAAPTPQSSAVRLDQFIPQELAAKLEAVRDGGAMVGERRVVTMLFCDVKGSTAAAEGLDPEEWTDIINGAFAHMIEPIYTYEGTVARMMGDGILAFFGAPIAHEDDPERAVLAGLDIVDRIAAYRETVRQTSGIDFNVRVGINTGRVVVGAVGSDLRMEYTAMGDAINLAARMEQTAEPGTVQIAADTYRRVKPLFEFESLGGIEVKGKSEPVEAYRVLRRRAAAGLRRGIEGRQVPLVGRDRELGRLEDALSIVQNGVGHIVSLIGDAGLGKTRLISEAKALIGEETVDWVEASSLSYESMQPYGLFQRLLRRLNDISPTDDAATIREKLTPLINLSDEADRPRTRLVLETLFNIQSGGEKLEGEAFKREFFAVMPTLWQLCFAARPSILVFDDLHWSDPASIDLLIDLLSLTGRIPLGVICAYRPDRQGPVWQIKTTAEENHHHRYTEIRLRPLTDDDIDAIIDRLQIKGLPDSLRMLIRERAGGNPFFVEEVVRSLIDGGALVAEARADGDALVWQADAAATHIDIPGNLQSLLAARIDRLAEDTRQVLQLAAVIGRSFYQRVLETISGDGRDAAIDEQLRLLLRLEMIREAARMPEIEYRFSNPLTQEVAYETILHKRRRELHRSVGEAMEILFPDQLTELAPRLAYHFAEAQDANRAFRYYALAGDTAYRLYAHSEAITNYRLALDWVDQAEAESDTLLRLYNQLGRAQEHASDYRSALATYEAMEAQADRHADRPLKLAALLERAKLYVTMNPMQNPALGQAVSDEALALARELQDSGAEAQIHWTLQLYHLYSGLTAQAVYHGEKALELARQTPLDERRGLILNDTLRAHIMSGHVAEVLPLMDEAKAAWEEIGNASYMVDVYLSAASLAYNQGNYPLSLSYREPTIELGEASGNVRSPATITMSSTRVCLMLGEIDTLLHQVTESVALTHRVDHPSARLDIQTTGAMALAVVNQIAEGKQIATEAEATALQFFPSWALWPRTALARLALREGDLEAARGYLAQIHETKNAENTWTMFWYPVLLVNAEVDVQAGDYAAAHAAMLPLATRVRETGYFDTLPEALYWLGQAQIGLGDTASATAALREAAQVATRINQRVTLWRILAALADLTDAAAEKQAALAQARAVIAYIADHAGPEAYRASFLARPDVIAVMQTAEPTTP